MHTSPRQGGEVDVPRSALVVLTQTALAVLTCLLFIGRKNFWLDESYSFVAAHRPLGDLLRLVTHDESNMSPYYLALHEWLRIGRSEGTIRLLSVPAAVATVPVIYSLAHRLRGQRTALVAGFLAAGNLMLVTYAQEARAYSLVLFLVTLSMLLFVELVSAPRIWVAVAWALVSAVAVYAHYFAAFVIVAQVASLLLLLPRRQWPRSALVAAGGVAALVAPLAAFVLHRGTSPLSSAQGASLLGPARLVYRYSGSLALAVVMLVLCGYAGLRTWRELQLRGWHRGPDAWRALMPWIWLVLPALLAFLGSLVHPMWKERYLIVSLPAFVLLVAAGIAGIEMRALRTVTAAVVGVLMVIALVGYYRGSVKQDADWRAASAYTLARTQPGDGLWFLPSTGYVPFAYYAWKRAQPPPPDTALTPDALHGRIHPMVVSSTVVAARLRALPRACVVLLAPTLRNRRAFFNRQLRVVAHVLVGFSPAARRDFGPLLTVRCYIRTDQQS